MSSAADDPARRRAESLPIAALLVALTAIAPFSVDMLIPSLPTLSREFHASSGAMQLTVTLFILSFASGQLAYGPAADRVGRRPVLLAGLSLFTLGGVACLLSQSAGMLILGRVIQGLGGGVGPAVAQAVVVDIWGRGRAARVFAYMGIATPLAPAVSPIVGGVLHDAIGWRAVFVTLIGLGVLLALLTLVMLPETNPRHRRTLGDERGLRADYRTVLASRTFLGFVLVLGLLFSGQLLFISSSSYVLIDELGLSARAYGFAFAFFALGLMIGATLSSRLVARMSLPAVVRLGVTGAAAAAALMLALALAGEATVAAVLGPMFLVGIGLGVVRPAAIAGAIVPFPQMAGLASSTLLFGQQLIATSSNIVYGLLVPAGAVALSGGMAGALALGLVAVLLVLRMPARPLAAASPPPPGGSAGGAG